MKLTSKERKHLRSLAEEKGRIYQDFVDSGVLTDIFAVKNPFKINRGDLRQFLQLPALQPEKPFAVQCNFRKQVYEFVPPQHMKWWAKAAGEYVQQFSWIKKENQLQGVSVRKEKALCVPVALVGAHRTTVWEHRGFQMAGLDETIKVFFSTTKQGIFFCGLPYRDRGEEWFLGFKRWGDRLSIVNCGRTGIHSSDHNYLAINEVSDQRGRQMKSSEIRYVMLLN